MGFVGLGEGFQDWLVDRGVIAHDYAEDQAWATIDALTARKWPTTGGELDVMHWGIDTGAFTQALYDRVSGRHALLATKGDNRPSVAPLKKGRVICAAIAAGRSLAVASIWRSSAISTSSSASMKGCAVWLRGLSRAAHGGRELSICLTGSAKTSSGK
jgi:phage terminase large subunit GpA-like protein